MVLRDARVFEGCQCLPGLKRHHGLHGSTSRGMLCKIRTPSTVLLTIVKSSAAFAALSGVELNIEDSGKIFRRILGSLTVRTLLRVLFAKGSR